MLVLKKIFFLVVTLSIISQNLNAQKSLWVTLKPNTGSVNQTDTDITINNGTTIDNYSSGFVIASQTTSGADLVYSITYTGTDVDNDGNNDDISFDIRLKGYVAATYTYSEVENMSSVTNYGTQSDVAIVANGWGVLGDEFLNVGESLTYEIENLVVTGVTGISFESGFTSISLTEPNSGVSHRAIFGFGTSLTSLGFNAPTEHVLSSINPLSITGAETVNANRDWGIDAIKLKIVINSNSTTWDITDYSNFENGPSLSYQYPTEAPIQKTTLPKFSWNKIPRWVAVRNNEAFSDEQVIDIANNFSLVMLEKANQQGFEYIEDGIENAATRIKALNPDITTLFYYNTYINYNNYFANVEYEVNTADWSTYEINADTGENEIYLFKDLYYWYNHDIEGMRDWWIDTCIGMANLDVIDGVFVDKVINPDVDGNAFDTSGIPLNNYTLMLNDLYNTLPANKLVVGNTLRNHRAAASRPLMEFMDGSYMERWNIPADGQTEADAIAVSIQLMREALQEGKMINFQTSPEHSTDEEPPTDETELHTYIEENVYFPLAVFLMIAEENAYFSYMYGVNALSTSSDVWDTSFIEEFSYKLGEPLGDPTKNGYVYERSFENLTVSVNIETKETTFNWIAEEAFVPNATLEENNIWYYNHTTNEFPATVNNTTDGTLQTNITTPSTNGVSSSTVSLFTKEEGFHSNITLDIPYNITSAENLVFKMKLYTDSNTTTTNNVKFRLKNSQDNTVKITETLEITKMDSWEEYTFDFTSRVFDGEIYNQIQIFFASKDDDSSGTGNTYYLDALQGPNETVLLTTDDIVSNKQVFLSSNIIENNFSLNTGIKSAVIYNMTGQEMVTFSNNQNQYDVSGLKTGIYILTITLTNNKKETLRIIKN